MILDTGSLGWRRLDGGGPLAEVIVGEIKRNRSPQNFPAFCRGRFVSGEPSAMHSQSVVLLLDMRGRNRGEITLPANGAFLDLDHLAGL